MEEEVNSTGYFKGIFTKKKIIRFLISDLLGNFIGFAVGFLTTSMFTHYVTERKSIKNLFGILPRKQMIVDDTPTWLHWLISILLGFIVMETFRYLFYEKNYINIWNKIKTMSKNRS
jgi:uncharacterized membrane protein